MPRDLVVPSRLYEPDTREFSINGFVKNDTDHALLTLTVEDWPPADPIITGWFRWDSGGGQDIFIRSPLLDRFRQPMAVWSLSFQIWYDKYGKRPVHGATVSLTNYQPLRTAVSLRAVPL